MEDLCPERRICRVPTFPENRDMLENDGDFVMVQNMLEIDGNFVIFPKILDFCHDLCENTGNWPTQLWYWLGKLTVYHKKV